jgi:hypothetical protein
VLAPPALRCAALRPPVRLCARGALGLLRRDERDETSLILSFRSFGGLASLPAPLLASRPRGLRGRKLVGLVEACVLGSGKPAREPVGTRVRVRRVGVDDIARGFLLFCFALFFLGTEDGMLGEAVLCWGLVGWGCTLGFSALGG